MQAGYRNWDRDYNVRFIRSAGNWRHKTNVALTKFGTGGYDLALGAMHVA